MEITNNALDRLLAAFRHEVRPTQSVNVGAEMFADFIKDYFSGELLAALGYDVVNYYYNKTIKVSK